MQWTRGMVTLRTECYGVVTPLGTDHRSLFRRRFPTPKSLHEWNHVRLMLPWSVSYSQEPNHCLMNFPGALVWGW